MTRTGVFPCYENQFKVDVSESGSANFVNIADCETFDVAFDNGVEEWTPFTSEGWTRRLMTAKSVTMTVTAKRNLSDPGNDFIASLAFKNGQAAQKPFQWRIPGNTKDILVTFTDAVINVTNYGAGDSTNVAPLEFEVMSNGKPNVTEVSE